MQRQQLPSILARLCMKAQKYIYSACVSSLWVRDPSPHAPYLDMLEEVGEGGFIGNTFLIGQWPCAKAAYLAFNVLK